MEQETRIAVIGIIVEDKAAVSQVNISIVVDAPMDKISALSGKLGKLPGVSAKALYSKSKGTI